MGSFGEFGEEGGFDSLGSHESPGVGSDLVYEDEFGFVDGQVGLVESLAEVFIGGRVFAGHDDLCAGESVARRVTACGLFALLGLGPVLRWALSRLARICAGVAMIEL
ncbi:MAG TPA: hypothetical protein VM120_22300 [Bryobacteraceae bacterium]|nr:hypothetical protein [Bryobacteraceae bacterium]